MNYKFVLAIIAAANFFLVPTSKAESIFLGVGSGTLKTNAELQSVQITSHNGLLDEYLKSMSLRTHVEWSIFGMRGKGVSANQVGVIGVSPVLRYFDARQQAFVEAGLGAYYFSERMLNQDDGVGTRFDFGSLVGFGTIVGTNRNVEVGYRLLHFSNAGMTNFNPGVNFHQVRLGYRF